MTNWVYWKSEPQLWTVGYFAPDDTRHTDSDYGSKEEAAARVHYLNGGSNAEKVNSDLLDALKITQRTTAGSWAEGYKLYITGVEMDVIQAAIAKATE